MRITFVCGISGAIGAFFIKTTFLPNQSSNFKGGGKRRRTAAAGVLCASLLLTLLFVPNAQIARADSILGSVAAGTSPTAVAVNPVTNRIYVANENSNNVTVIDGTNNMTTTVAAGTAPRAVAVNPATNKIYVANFNSNNVTVIDGTNNTTTTVAAGTSPTAVAVNPVTNKIYVANNGSSNLTVNSVTVIDGTNNSTQTVATGAAPVAVAVNPVTNKIYVANFNSGNITVIDGTNNSTQTVAAGTFPNAVAVNPVTNRIYVANKYSGNVTVIDGTNNSTQTVATGADPRAVAVNPVTNKIYVANENSSNVTVIDGTNNSTQTVAAGLYPRAVAVNLVTNKIYVANVNIDNVTAITPAPKAAIPLNTAITPAANNTTTQTPTFTLTATSTYAPNAPPPQNVYFQIDTINGAFTKAVEQSRTATMLTAKASPAALQPGLHIIYFFAADGSDATSINPNRPTEENFGKDGFDNFAPESSPIIGGINAYEFLVTPAAPTAAAISISGRVTTASGRGITNVRLSLTDSNGQVRTTTTTSFGYYRFDDVQAGETYILSASGKHYTFSQPLQVLNVNDETTEVNFIANPEKKLKTF